MYRRTAFFLLALAALLAVARPDAHRWLVGLLFVAFIATAAIWIAGQYTESLDGRQPTVPVWLWIVLLVAAAGLIVLYVRTGWGGTALGGLFLIYLLFGSAVAGLRQREPGPWWLGFALIAAATLMAVAGAALLWLLPGRIPLVAVALLAAGVFVVLPVGIALASERTIRGLSARLGGAVFFGIAGLLLLGVTGWLSVRVSHSLLILWVLGVVAVLVVAVASATQADVALVVALIALMGVTPVPAGQPDLLRPAGGQRVLVALGDSFMSGEGAEVYYDGTDEADPARGDQCRRAPTAWAVAASRSPWFDGLEFLACSGARTWNVLPTPPAAPDADVTLTRKGVPGQAADRGDARTQLDEYLAGDKGFTPAMAVLSVGGNDAGFSTIGQMCLAPGHCNDRSQLWTTSMAQVERNLRATYVAMDDAFPGVPVAVVPYPDPIQLSGSCNQLALSRREKEFLQEFVDQLNGVITRTAAEFGFYVVGDMQRALAAEHLQLCDPANDGRPGLNFVELRSVRGSAEERYNPKNWSHGSLHPNERGHAAMSRTFQSWLARQPVPMPARQQVTAAAAASRQAALVADRKSVVLGKSVV
ncbi:GDSL-type esterase/lipase family protein, partial [Actinoplanes sp. NPDC051633]|uniref:GDSL-type esterase/lipase family protein n=1 Tax=Actinoplanes sp. NPDC051633 TaxID=3155670 RepID=UPI00344991B3